ncbi:hypothetical protein K445DRAFT_19310 [Daldinia sp. EC12]|nr:hypothetical protein K445DRAFT_19310 [Daldinia sp. EC12]
MAEQDGISDKPAPYKYRPLSLSAHTRVLELQPSLDQSAPICCSLFEVNLDHEGQAEYDALSYTWGAPSFTEEVFIDRSYLMITPNLFYALRRFRMPTETRMIWVDAICINQEDDKEKARQIPFMRQIYRSASSVLVWLGIDESGFESLRRLHHYAKRPQSSASTVDVNRELNCITKLPWFHRRWIIQEVVLNPNVIFNCAEASMPWTRLLQVLNVGVETGIISSLVTMAELWKDWILRKDDAQPRMFNLLTSFHDSQCQDPRDIIYALGGLASDVDLRDDSNRAEAIAQKYSAEQSADNESPQVIGGTDLPKGTGDSGKAVIPVDYTVSVEWLYYEVVVRLLDSRALEVINLIAQCAVRNTGDESDQMPSWIPDWRKPKMREPPWLTPTDVQGSINPNDRSILTIKSSSIHWLGQVSNNRVSAVFPENYDESRIHKWLLDTWASLSELEGSQNGARGHQPSEHVLARLVNTVLNEKTPYQYDGMTSFNKDGFEKSWAEYRGYLQRTCESIQQGARVPEFYKFIYNDVKGRTVFVWQDAANSQPQYGVGPPHARPGDTILTPGSSMFQAFFNSGTRPLNTKKSSFLLRQCSDGIDLPVEKGDRVLPGRFRLVGDCQVMLYSGRIIHDLTKESDAYEPLRFSWFRQFSLS